MKKCLLATVMMMAATAVYAEPTAMLKVHGTLTSAGCVPEISNGGVADFGEVGLDSLSSGVAYQAGHKDVTLTITCQSATRVGWTIKDDRKYIGKLICTDKASITKRCSGSGLVLLIWLCMDVAKRTNTRH